MIECISEHTWDVPGLLPVVEDNWAIPSNCSVSLFFLILSSTESVWSMNKSQPSKGKSSTFAPISNGNTQGVLRSITMNYLLMTMPEAINLVLQSAPHLAALSCCFPNLSLCNKDFSYTVFMVIVSFTIRDISKTSSSEKSEHLSTLLTGKGVFSCKNKLTLSPVGE